MHFERGTGRTTKQILNAPLNSIYICGHSQEINYCKRIAYENNRQDLTFYSAGFLLLERLRGLNRFIVIDHAAELNIKSYDYIQAVNSRFKHDKIS
jgi:hypothetical protein